MSETNERLSVRDPDRVLRETFARIGARIEAGGDMAAGVRYAASFTDGATRNEQAPPNWDQCDLVQLREYAIYGYDYRVRAAALAKLEARLLSTVRP